MNRILCPTRGGEDSYKNQDKAIELAKERSWGLTFLYVSNVDFLLNLSSPMMVKSIQDDLDDMGEFLLTIAQERAEKQGVQADITLEHGIFFDALKKTLLEQDIDTLMLGSSQENEGHTNRSYLDELIGHILELKKIEIIVTYEGQVIKHVNKQENISKS
jgi:nucleotide-binding universal stress UspA family protein